MIASAAFVFCSSFFFVNCVVLLALSASTIVAEEFCVREKFQANCVTKSPRSKDGGSLVTEGRIVMRSARYGRIRLGRCIQQQFDRYHGCSINVIDTMHKLCSGRPSCSVDVFQTFSQLRPCSELEAFLDAEYDCVDATPSCRGLVDSGQTISSDFGFVSGLGSRDGTLNSGAVCRTTVILRAKPGQRWNISLFDFVSETSVVAEDKTGTRCLQYAFVSDGDAENSRSVTTQPVTICDGVKFTERSVYLSETRTIRIDVHGRQIDEDGNTSLDGGGQFLLKYAVTGCTDPDQLVLNSAVVKREQDQLIITCNSTGFEYRLRCVGNVWTGQTNHSCAALEAETVWFAFKQSWTSVHGILVVTGLGIALGVLVGCTMLGLAAMCHKYRDALSKRAARDQLQATGCPYSSAYRPADDSRHLDHLSSAVGCKQVLGGNGTYPACNSADYFDERSVAKYGTNPSYAAMISSSATTGVYSRGSTSITANYCTDHTGFPVPPDSTAMFATSPPRQQQLDTVRLHHGSRMVHQAARISTFARQNEPEVEETTRNYFFVHDVHRLPETVGVMSANQSSNSDSPFSAFLLGDVNESSVADGYNESILSNASSSALDDHIYELAG